MDHPDVGDGPTAVVPASPPAGGFAAEKTDAPPQPPTASAASVAPPTPALSVSSAAMSRWKRSNMKFRRQAIALFEPAAAAAAAVPKNRKPYGYGRPKVTIRFARTALEEAAVAAATATADAEEPQQVAAIKLKYLGLESKSQRPKYRVE